jgi:hypothetical protein
MHTDRQVLADAERSPSSSYVFRPVRTTEELHAALALRYRTYAPQFSGLESLDHASALDVDAYDAFAHHLGLFAEHPGRDELVGCMRVVFDGAGPWQAELHWLAATTPDLASRILAPRGTKLPLQNYYPPRSPARAAIDRILQHSRRCGEAGRFAIEPVHRLGVGRRGARLSCSCVEAAWAWAFGSAGMDCALVACLSALSPLYERCGFVPLSPASHADICGSHGIVLEARPELVAPWVASRVDDYSRQWHERGQVVLTLDTGSQSAAESLAA